MSRKLMVALLAAVSLAVAATGMAAAATLAPKVSTTPQIHLHVSNELLQKTPHITPKLHLNIVCYHYRRRTGIATYETVNICGPG